MAAINFPASPAPGDTFTAAGVTWTWDGSKWTGNGLSQSYLPLAGGTMNGPLTLAGNPVGVLDAAPKQYVDAQSLYPHDNRIINGDMRIDQRNNGASGTASLVYTVDRWFYQANQTSKGTWGRGPSGVPGFPYYLGFTSSSAYASLAADIFGFNHRIEADMVSDFAWGTASAQAVTLSFWAFPSLSGTFSGSVRNYAGDRSYPFTFPLTANTWTKTVIVIPGDTAGTWVLSGNAGAVILNFDLGSGSNSRGPANAWAAGNYFGATGAVNVVAVNGAYIYFTGVKLEIGSVATLFNRQTPAKSMVDCQRYFRSYKPSLASGHIAQFFASNVATAGYSAHYVDTPMRASPTINVSGNFLAWQPAASTAVTFNAASLMTPLSWLVAWTSTGLTPAVAGILRDADGTGTVWASAEL